MIYEYSKYKPYLRALIKAQPKNGRGFLKRMADAMNLTSAQMSHVMAGETDFTLEQALSATKYLALNARESEYFIEMVLAARAGTTELRSFSKNRLERMKTDALEVKNQLPEHEELTDTQKAIFYSSWLYSAIRLYCSIDTKTVDEVVEYFEISRERCIEILQFLVSSGLCVSQDGGFVMGSQTTFVSKDSPFNSKHHSNWRIKAIEKCENLDKRDFNFTAPISLSEKDFDYIRGRLNEVIKEIGAQVKDSKSETIACLCLDLFQLKRKN